MLDKLDKDKIMQMIGEIDEINKEVKEILDGNKK